VKARAAAVAALVAVVAVPSLAWVEACSLSVDTAGLSGGCPGCTDAASPTRDAAPDDSAADAMTADAACTPGVDGGLDSCGGCSGGILYVATTGADTNDGCSSAAPKATLQAAADQVASSDLSQRIEVCKGTYTASTTVVTKSVQMYGGYDCSSWTRTATYGAPSFDGVNETILAASSDGSGDGAAITFNTSSVTRAAVLDGFTVQGAPYGSIIGDSYAVLDTTGASPTLTNDKIIGSSGNVARTVGVEVVAAGGPEIAFDRIEGGGGQRSIAVSLEEAASAFVHDDTLAGGSGTVQGSYGLFVLQSGPLTGANSISNNVIDGGTGGGATSKSSSFGVYLSGSDADFLGNTVSTGSPTCTIATCAGHAVFVTTAAANHVLFQANRLYSSPTAFPNVVLGGSGTGDLRIFDNLIDQTGGSAGSIAVELASGSGSVFADNTVFGQHFALALTAEQNMTTYVSFTNNAMVGYAGPRVTESCSNDAPTSTLAAFQAALGSTAGGNTRVDSSCAGDTSATSACGVEAACGTAGSSCFGTILTHWDDASSGVADLLDTSKSWRLAPSAPCLVSQIDTQRTPPIATDFGGTLRSAPFSAGAWESDALCSMLTK
jgi:hypothetical protein